MIRNKIKYLTDEAGLVRDCADNRSEYICDAISETADNAVDIYTRELLEWAIDNPEYIDEAAQEGLVDMRNTDNIMVKLAQAGQYEYYTQQLYKDIVAIVLNYAFEYLKTDEIPDDLAELLESKARDYDKFSEIEADLMEYANENNQ